MEEIKIKISLCNVTGLPCWHWDFFYIEKDKDFPWAETRIRKNGYAAWDYENSTLTPLEKSYFVNYKNIDVTEDDLI